jgi:type I restriction enzyme, R subunit
MTKLSESDIELYAIDIFQKLGYEWKWGPDIAPDGGYPERSSWEDVLLHQRLSEALIRINPAIPGGVLEDALKQLKRLNNPLLIANNEAFHRMLTEGVNVTYQKDGMQRGDLVWLIDFKNPDNNDFLVVNQFTVVENSINKRLDIVIFINGIPLVVMELKNAADENATLFSAFKQLETYKATIPGLFTYNGIVVISDGLDAKAGSLSAGYSRFMTWKTADGKSEASKYDSQLVTLLTGMLNKKTLLDLIRHFIVFEKDKKEDLKTGQITIETVKKLAGYHQYYAVNKAVESTLKAASTNGSRKGGVIWHTQGSGKSLSMVFFTGKLVLQLDNPTIVVITDRNDLDDQLFDTFAASKQLLRQTPVQAKNREDLKELLKVASGGIVFTTIHKFNPEEGNVYECLSYRRNIVVIADEAHRTQYGFRAKTIDEKDDQGNTIGKKVVYGFAKYMRDALPNATYLGFTGTPIESADVNTPAVFGNYIDVYDIAQAVEDGATVRIYYESRLAKVRLSEEGKKLISDLDKDLEEEDLSDTQKAKAKWTQLEALVGSKDRIKKLAKDIITHFEARQEAFAGKGMIVTMSRRIAVELYNEIIKLCPEWHSDDLSKGVIKVVMTAASSDGPEIARHHTTKEQRRALSDRMKDDDDEMKLVIVRDMWLTGFDVPSLHTMYIDKPMRGHNLMQAIARVNRVYKDKPGGLIVDYLGIATDLKEALFFYSESGGKGDPTLLQEQAVELMLEKLEIVSQMFSEMQPSGYREEQIRAAADPGIRYITRSEGFRYEEYFTATTSEKLKIILAAEDYILGLKDGKKRFIDEVTALSKAFALAVPHEKAMDIKDEVAFFQAIRARLIKLEPVGGGRKDVDIDTAIRQVVDKALVTDSVVDIYAETGIKKPDISILSEDFLRELKDMEHKNIAMEVLKKLLNDEIRARAKRNLVQSRTLMEMLEESIRKYQNKILTAAQVIEELIRLSKDIREMDKEPQEMGLSEFEYAFYTAVADNKSARELMQKDVLRHIAKVLTERVRKNATIDWTIKESVRAKLRVIVRRTLREYGYPPDMQKLATETVLKQAEMLAEELAG